jgi:hypothetical protein
VDSRGRFFWLSISSLAYVCFAAVRSSPTSWLVYGGLVALPLGLAEAWRRTGRPGGGEDRVEPAARAALRAALWGAALWAAARLGPAGQPGFDAVANLGAGASVIGGLVALARVGSMGGVLVAPKASRSLDAAAFAGLLWGVATAVPATQALWPSRVVLPDPLAVDYVTTAAGLGSLFILAAAAWRLRILRRIELGVGDRAAGALAVAVASLLLAVPAALFDAGPPDRVVPVTVIIASLVCTWTVTTAEPTDVSSSLRGILAVMVLGVPITLAGSLMAQSAAGQAGLVVMATSTLAILVGLMARTVARPLGPEQSRWLEAIEAANRGALQPEPDAAIRASLESLARATSSVAARPELWRVSPAQVLNVDIAGYLHVHDAEAPAKLYELALTEPERTVRAEALRAVQVRRPDVRGLLDWFGARHAFSATLIVDDDGPIGFILLPRGNRAAPMALEEARAARLLADRISALLAVSSALARSREREMQTARRADGLEADRSRLEQIILQKAGRYRALAAREARRVYGTAYSPAARVALTEIERVARSTPGMTLIVPSGVAAVAWAAVAHLASPRSGGPMVIVDGSSGAEHDLQLWEDPVESPLNLAEGGTLVLLDASALPLGVQELLGQAFSRLGSAAVDSQVARPGVVTTLRRSVDQLTGEDRLYPSFARWLAGTPPILVPSLASRAEDLRALALDILGRSGLSLHGRPLGVGADALRLIVEHDWPGNDLELESVLTRSAAIATGPVVTASDLLQVGFSPAPEDEGSAPPAPESARFRTPRSRAGRVRP